MNFIIENSDFSPPLSAPVVYRPALSDWWVVAIALVCIAAIFAFSCLPLVNMGELTAREIAGKKGIESNVPGIWLPLVFGVLWLLVTVVQIGALLFARVLADENGLRWRPFPFVQWKSARWDEVTDCVLPKPKTAGNAEIVMGQERISFDLKNSSWPALRDFVAARVALPDGLEAWRVPTQIDAETRRVQSIKSDDGAPIRTTSKVWTLLIFGCVAIAVIGSMFQYAVNNDPNPKASNQIFVWVVVALIAAFFIVYPLLSQWRRFIRADDEGLLLAQITRQRRIGWAQIEDLFLLAAPQKDWSARVYIVVAGENIRLERLGQSRDAMLNRIEARATNSRSRQFELREALPVGAELSLPATLEARAARRALLRQSALLGVVTLSLFAGLTAVIFGIGWRYFGTTRGIFVLGALGYALMLIGWARRFGRGWRLLRAWGDASLRVDETGLTMRQNATNVRIEWRQIRAFTRDSRSVIGDMNFRVEGEGGAVIEWDSWWPRAFLVAALVAEKSDVKLESSLKSQRRFHGLTRDADGFVVSKNTPLERQPLWIVLGMWATFSIVPSFDMSARDWVWMQLLGWPSLLFYGALFYWWALARVRVRCDARGLHYRGLWRERSIAWSDVEEFGAGIYRDWVRARSGQTIRLWRMPDGSVTWAQTQLREEIERRAPHARGDWEID